MSNFACGGVVACFGALAGIIFLLFEGVEKLTKNNFIVVFIADVVAMILAGFLFIVSIFTVLDGYFAFFEVVCFLFGLVFVFFVKNFVASFILMLYNKVKFRRKRTNDEGKTD